MKRSDMSLAQTILLPEEFSLWSHMQNRDQRHSLDVLRRFDALQAEASRDERAAALLHDVGKSESTLGWWGRILATIFGPRTEAFRTYLDHEEIGLRLLAGVSSQRTLEVLQDKQTDAAAIALRNADQI